MNYTSCLRIALLALLGAGAPLPAWPQAPAGPGGGRFEVRVPAPGPDAIADEILQQAIDAVAGQGGGVVLLGAGDFKLSRKAGDETVVIKSHVTLRGQGYATHLYLDPTTPPSPQRYFPVRIGTALVPAHNVVIECLRYTGHDQAIGGGSIMGFNARLDEPQSLLLSCDNVTIRHCWIYDAKQAAGCTKPAAQMYFAKHVINPKEAAEASQANQSGSSYRDADRQAAQFKNWQVHNNYIETCGNKAIELAECNGGIIAGNHIVDVEAGPQVIFGSRNVQIRDNTVYFRGTGINITEGSHHIRVSGNHVEPMAGGGQGAVLPCLIFRTEPLPAPSVISDIVVTGNTFCNQHTTPRCTVRFQTRPESQSCVYEGICFTGNVFDGDVHFFDQRTPGRTTIRDILFADNVCEGAILSVPAGTMASRQVVVRGNLLRQAGSHAHGASEWTWTGNTLTQGTLEIATQARGNIVRDNVTAAPILDHGEGTILSGNLVRQAIDVP